MNLRVKLFHISLLAGEVGALVAMPLLFWIRRDESSVVQGTPWFVVTLIALGLGLLVAQTFMRFLRMDAENSHSWHVVSAFGVLLIVIGGVMAYSNFPTAFRIMLPADANLRWQRVGAVSVWFDVCGGRCGDLFRVTKNCSTYGHVMNVYPSEDERRMRLLNAKLDLFTNEFVVEKDNDTKDHVFINYFTLNAIPRETNIGKWTYVVDVGSAVGAFTAWDVGQTAGTNDNVYAELSYGRIRPMIKAGERQFLVLETTNWRTECNLLDRAYIHLKPGQHFKARFRVSLFAGTGISESNYHYVKPGETLACPLPIPTRDGYAFEGWYDGERRITEESRVEKRETHTLKARWRKL